MSQDLERKISAFEARKGQKTHSRVDAYVNAYSGFGGTRDPMTRTTFVGGRVLTKTELEDLYRFNWIARRIVDAIPEDVCRQGIKLNIEDQDLSARVITRLEKIGAWPALEEALCLARLYGGNIMVLGAMDGQEPTTALDERKLDQLKFLNNLDRWQLSIAQKHDDPMQENFGRVKTYRLQPMAASTPIDQRVIHASRVIRFDGAYLPDRLRIQNQGWADSVIIAVNEALKHHGTSVQAGAILFQDFITKVLKIPNLANLIADGEETTLMARIRYAVANMSSLGVALVGQDEEFSKIQTPITGLVELIDKYVDFVAAASGIPKTRLFGQQLGTLSGADETTRNYYDLVKAYQKKHLRAPVSRLISLILAQEKADPGPWSFEFASLWQPTEKENAETRKITAETDQIYISNNVLQPEEVAVSRFGSDGYSMETTIDFDSRKTFEEGGAE